ncbi:hypothetical protein [Kitasatospora terrestris]|uniref:Uncharacterized protein n=1 Tax=Kitasatospora terrestris TaxID=258051 RepID=A0ABP9EY49_9ACTN
MDDIPQGGAGGVPLHHDDTAEERGGEDREKRPGSRTAPTVRAGAQVAEQKAEPEPEPEEDGN